jgi:hypothetical protein
MQRACAILPGASLTLLYFPPFYHKLHDFRKKKTHNITLNTKHKMYVLIFSTTSIWKFLILRKIKRDTDINVKTSSCKSCQISIKLEFSGMIFGKSPKNKSNHNPFSGSIVTPCGRTDGQTYMTEIVVAFRNSSKAPKIPSSAHALYLCVLYGSENKQRLFHCTALTDWFL